ncbi:MAG: nuclear transport factor 2 family protein [Haloferacaceae archaeon]
MSAEATVREYYEALRRGDPLAPYFAGDRPAGDDAAGADDGAGLAAGSEDAAVVKYGIGERLVGHDAIAAGLREQTRTTADWTVESAALRVVERPAYAWFSDEVFLAWTDREADRERAFDTRWSGTLERRAAGDGDDGWRFVGMHVSVPHPIGAEDAEDADGEGTSDGRDAGRV